MTNGTLPIGPYTHFILVFDGMGKLCQLYSYHSKQSRDTALPTINERLMPEAVILLAERIKR